MSVILVGSSPEKIKFCKNHTHQNWEIVIPIFGKGFVETAEQKLLFSEGMAYCIPPNTEHFIHSEKGFCDIYIHTESLGLNPRKITAVRNIGSFTSLGELILSAYLKKDQGWRSTMDSTLRLITQLIYDLNSETDQNPLATGMRDYLVENISNPNLSMEELSTHFGYNADHLRRVFKGEYGVSPMEYLWEGRLNRASELLLNMSQYSIEEIANLCGFTDRFYFSRFFKKRKSVSPSDYRRGNTQN